MWLEVGFSWLPICSTINIIIFWVYIVFSPNDRINHINISWGSIGSFALWSGVRDPVSLIYAVTWGATQVERIGHMLTWNSTIRCYFLWVLMLSKVKALDWHFGFCLLGIWALKDITNGQTDGWRQGGTNILHPTHPSSIQTRGLSLPWPPRWGAKCRQWFDWSFCVVASLHLRGS